MYRYSVDNAITYTSEDFVLFKESPFASWMERLSLENPDHGILPQAGSVAPTDTIESQDDLADTLRAEGKDVVLVSWERDEASRRTATQDAMRSGADFIVNAQLAVGPLSGAVNLLMRTSGYSEFGNYLYVPCNTQRQANSHAALRLCFLADLLHSLQGQLPPQMLIIRGGSDLVTLETEDHIYHYRAVKHRFMTAQQAFRKHKMPDPAESAHFGRWAECANEVLKQRALRAEDVPVLELEPMESELTQSDHNVAQAGATAAEVSEPEIQQHIELDVEYEPQRVAASGGALDTDASSPYSPTVSAPAPVSSGTLAEQARMLRSNGQVISASAVDDDTLENLSFIGSSTSAPTIGEKRPQRSAPDSAAATKHSPDTPDDKRSSDEPDAPETSPVETPAAEMALSRREPRPLDPSRAPPPSLRNPQEMARNIVATPIPPTVDFEKLVYEKVTDDSPVMERTHPLDSAGFQSASASGIESPNHIGKESMIDRDEAAEPMSCEAAPPPSLGNVLDTPAQDIAQALEAGDVPDTIDADEVDAPAVEPVQEAADCPDVGLPEIKLDTIERAQERVQMDDRATYTEIFADSDEFLARPKSNKFNSALNTSDESMLAKPETER